MIKIIKFDYLGKNITNLSRRRFMSNKSNACCKTCPPVYECKQPVKEIEPCRFDDWREECAKPHPCMVIRKGNPKLWRNIFLFVCVPILIAKWVETFYIYPEKPKRPKFIKYSYLRIRNRPFPWEPSNKTFFHNPLVNALPDGYEVELPEDEEVDS